MWRLIDEVTKPNGVAMAICYSVSTVWANTPCDGQGISAGKRVG
jgi:hypothetical protein